MISGSKTVASKQSGTASPCNRPSGVTRKFSRSSPAAARTIASSSDWSASFCRRVMTLPRISTTVKSGRYPSNCALRRVLLVANVGALAHGAQCQTGGQLGGQILQTVNREVGPMFEQGDFEFFGEKPFGQ